MYFVFVIFSGFGAETYPAFHSKFLKRAIVELIDEDKCYENITGELPDDNNNNYNDWLPIGDGYCAAGQ